LHERTRNAAIVAEERGFHFVHAIVDSLWLKKSGVSDEEVEILRREIESATGLPLLGATGRTTSKRARRDEALGSIAAACPHQKRRQNRLLAIRTTRRHERSMVARAAPVL